MVKQKTAIYPLSADPVHNGHMQTVRRTVESGFFDKLYVAIGVNPFKKTLFSLDERLYLTKKVVESAGFGDKVGVVSFEGLLRNYARSQGIHSIVRSYRNGTDAEYESSLASFNEEYGIKTWLLPAEKGNVEISSSMVRAVASEFGFVQKLVHPAVKQALEEKLRGVSLVGVTGCMGAGKSTFCNSLVEYSKSNGNTSVSHIDFDKLVHSLYLENTPLGLEVREEIKENFGEEVFMGKELDRRKLAGIVFGDKDNRNKLSRILYVPSMIKLEEE
jgi:pantetheine-phosphate adenylyltransferase